MCTHCSLSTRRLLVVLLCLSSTAVNGQNSLSGSYSGTYALGSAELELARDNSFSIVASDGSHEQTGVGRWRAVADSLFLSFDDPFYLELPTWTITYEAVSTAPTITFMVQARYSGELLSGAAVVLGSGDDETGNIVGPDGWVWFQLNGREGYHTVRISYVGYVNTYLPVEIPGNRSMHIDVKMARASDLSRAPWDHGHPVDIDGPLIGFRLINRDGGRVVLESQEHGLAFER